MTVSTQTNQVSYTLNGATVAFPVPFYFIADAHITAWTLQDGLHRMLVPGTDYTLTGAGDEDGGTFITTSARDDGTLYITRIVPVDQLTEYPPNTPFPASSHERALDKLTMICQQLLESISNALTVDPYNPDGPFDAKGRRIVNLGDAIAYTDAVNLQTLLKNISGAAFNGLVTDPQIWRLAPDGTTKTFFLPGADVSQTEWYDVLVAGTMIEPDDGYTIQISPDTDGSTITFATAPAGSAETWVVLRGYAKPASDYVTTLINDTAFINFLKSLIANTLYESTDVLELGPTKLLIPLADVTGSATIDGSKESYLLRSTSATPVNFTIRGNTGDADLDWETNPIAAPYFSVLQVGAGAIALVADAGVTLRVPPGFIAQTRGKNSIVTATADYASGGQWVLSGDLALAPNAAAVGAVAVSPAASAAGVVPLDLSLASMFTLTLSENVTGWTITNAPPVGNGGTYLVRIIQNASAAKTITWPSSFKWAGTTKPAASTGLNAVDMLRITTFDAGASYEAEYFKAFA